MKNVTSYTIKISMIYGWNWNVFRNVVKQNVHRIGVHKMGYNVLELWIAVAQYNNTSHGIYYEILFYF